MGAISNIMPTHFLFYSPCAKTPACPHPLPVDKCKYIHRRRSADLRSYLWLRPPTHTSHPLHWKSDIQPHCKTKGEGETKVRARTDTRKVRGRLCRIKFYMNISPSSWGLGGLHLSAYLYSIHLFIYFQSARACLLKSRIL